MINYWHMQIHPDDQSFADDHIYSILEHKKIIGLGQWNGGQDTIDIFVNKMKVNDIVAIKNGSKLIALVQIVGGAYKVENDDSEAGWIKNRRPIRVLDWELWEKRIPQPRKTLSICVSNDAETTKIIKEWHKRVNIILAKRGISSCV